MEKALQELLDKQAISEQLSNYARAIDRRDYDIGKQVFHEDAVVDYGPDVFQGSGWDFIDWCLKNGENIFACAHLYCNISIRVRENLARSEAYNYTIARMNDDAGRLVEMRAHGRQIDEWEKRDGTWRIVKRIYLNDGMESRWFAEQSPFIVRGRRDRSDHSYIIDRW